MGLTDIHSQYDSLGKAQADADLYKEKWGWYRITEHTEIITEREHCEYHNTGFSKPIGSTWKTS